MNAYHFIRHVASGWATVLDQVMANNDSLSLVQDLGKYSFCSRISHWTKRLYGLKLITLSNLNYIRN